MTDSRKTERSSVEEMQRLRDLVLGEEKQRLHKLDRRIRDLEARTADVAEVLPAAMSRVAEDPVNRPDFERPVVNTIRSAIKRDSHSFAEALFPVLGPAIRRAVADALSGMVQRINVALENSFTIKGLKWRLEAARSGEPFAQIVLRHTMLYAVQEAFLIQRGSGLVLASVQRDETLALDEDAVAAMLTAIQSFIQDSFGEAADEPLRSAELGDRTMWVVNGPVAVLACVISGTPPRSLRDELMNLLETLHARFGRRFSEDVDGLDKNEGLRALMSEALLEEEDTESLNASRFKFRFLWLLAGLALAAFLVYSTVVQFQTNSIQKDAVQAFSEQPGYVVTNSDVVDGRVRIQGLRDPSTPMPGSVVEGRDIPAEKLEYDFRPYQSLDGPVVTERLARQLGISDVTRFELNGSRLSVAGALSSAQLQTLQALPAVHPTIEDVDLSGARLEAVEAMRLIRDVLQVPESVQLVPGNAVMTISGSADAAWLDSALAASIDTLGWELDFSPLKAQMTIQLDEQLADLNGRVFLFIAGINLVDESESYLKDSALLLKQAQMKANALSLPLIITLEGLGDGIGTLEKNRAVAQSRSDRVMNEFAALGVDVGEIRHTMGPWQRGGMNPERRKVTLRVQRGEEG